jgi:hypothetical protein
MDSNPRYRLDPSVFELGRRLFTARVVDTPDELVAEPTQRYILALGSSR